MTDISTFRANRFKESEYKRHQIEIKKLKANNRREYSTESKKGKNAVTNIKDEYESKLSQLKVSVEKRITDLRAHQEDLIRMEDDRLKNELADLKKSHDGQLEEIRESQTNQITEIKRSHAKTLANARAKFLSEQNKMMDA